MFSSEDTRFMRRALELAANGLFTTDPNPRVGCVIVRDQHVVGEGWHEKAGQPHAEIHAMKQAGKSADGATAYVTLEPCAHYGRTPPCCDALIQAGISRVVVAAQDPNPLVNGKGVAALTAAGIKVELGLLQEEASELNIGFLSRMRRQRPWVRMKVAASLDGKTALPNRQSQWITDEAARRDGHKWRARASALLTGIGTLKDDDPQMNVRWVETSRQPIRVLVDSRLEANPQAKMLLKPGAWIVTALEETAQSNDAWKKLSDAGHRIVSLPNQVGKVDLQAMLRWLASEGVNELHIEAGYKLNGSLLREHCVDELLCYIAPRLMGPGLEMFDLPELSTMPENLQWCFVDHEAIGRDLRLSLRKLASIEELALSHQS